MGAFGRLLIQSWGGDLKSYDGDKIAEAITKSPAYCIYCKEEVETRYNEKDKTHFCDQCKFQIPIT
jgi:hypothetical protein